MKANEEPALAKFIADGWSPFRKGWPDYLLVRATKDGKLEFMGVEVKCEGEQLGVVQAAMYIALRTSVVTPKPAIYGHLKTGH